MSSTATTDLTGLLRAWSAGDSEAGDKLIPLVYQELHHQAARYLSRERSNHTLRPTALVNEAYLRLARQRRVVWQDRAQFFGVAATVMRRLLVDHARQHAASKRGAWPCIVSLDDGEIISITGSPDLDIIALNDALVGADGRRSGPGAHDRAAVLCRTDDRRDGRGDGRVGRLRDARLAAGAGLAASSAHEGIAPTSARRRRNPVTYDPRTLGASGGDLRIGSGARAPRRAPTSWLPPARTIRRCSAKSGAARLARAGRRLRHGPRFPCGGNRRRRTSGTSAPATGTLDVGSRLGRYEIVSLLGAGGMGEVYRARDPQLDREVGIKILPRARRGHQRAAQALRTGGARGRRAQSPEHPDGLRRRRGAATSLTSSPSCSRGKRCARASTPVALPVEQGARHRAADRRRADGGARQGRRAPRHQAREPVRHARRPGQDSRFRSGQADRRLPRAAMAPARRTPSGTRACSWGRPGTCRPNRCAASRWIARSDIFAFGAVLYEMLAGRRAFTGDSAIETMNAILTSDPPPLPAGTSELPAPLWRIVQQCLEKNLEHRFSSTRALGTALDDVQHSMAASPRTFGPPKGEPGLQRNGSGPPEGGHTYRPDVVRYSWGPPLGGPGEGGA